MPKVTLTSVNISSNNNQGMPYLDSQGRPFNRVSITTEEHGQKVMSGISYQDGPIMGFRQGMVVDIEIEEKGQYTNFKLPRKSDPLLAEMNGKLNQIISMLAQALPQFEHPKNRVAAPQATQTKINPESQVYTSKDGGVEPIYVPEDSEGNIRAEDLPF